MKFFALLCLVAAMAASAAPADQYFGKLKMSSLRIRDETFSIRKRYEGHRLLPEEAVHLALLTENAFDDWDRRYPHDDWLASSAYNLAKLYEELPGITAQQHAEHLLRLIDDTFGKTRYGHLSRLDLERGISLRPDPAWAAALRATRSITPSPSPTAAPSTLPSPTGSASPRTSPSASPSASPSSTPKEMTSAATKPRF